MLYAAGCSLQMPALVNGLCPTPILSDHKGEMILNRAVPKTVQYEEHDSDCKAGQPRQA